MTTSPASNLQPFPAGLITFASVVTACLLVFGIWGAYDTFHHVETTEAEVQSLERIRSDIVFMDEVLTMSASMAANTGDRKWIERYERYEPQLGKVIDEAIRVSGKNDIATAVGETKAANDALVDMEIRSFDFVRQGDPDAAWAILSSDTYRLQKRIYADGMAKVVNILDANREALTATIHDRLVFLMAGHGHCFFIGYLRLVNYRTPHQGLEGHPAQLPGRT